MSKCWNGFQIRVLESEVVDVGQCQVVSVEEIYEYFEEGLNDCGDCMLRLGR